MPPLPAGGGAAAPRSTGLPLRCLGLLCRPARVVVGDMDGVIVVPRRIAVAVLERAEQILGNEREIFRWVAEGDSVRQITEKGGYF